MKKLTITLTSLAVLALAGTTMAANPKIYITGSTAFRFGTVQGIINIYSGGTTATSTGGATGANAVTFAGGTVSGVNGGNPVDIKCAWSGSAAGVQTVGGTPTFTVQFLPDGASGTSNPDPRSSTIASQFEAARPDIAMSDVFQGTTPFNGTFNGHSYNALTDNVVGVITFTFAASKNFPGKGSGGDANYSNYSMTPQIAQTLFPGGSIPLAFFTGNSGTDDNTAVLATGRDFDSGTRLTAVSETGVGTSQLLKQWKPTVSGTTITSLVLYPQTTINGVDTQQNGNSGESSGSSLRAFLNDTMTAAVVQSATGDMTWNGGYLVTYLGISDFNAVSNNAVGLLYTGNLFSQNNVIEGKYTFWGYEHLDYRSSATAPVTDFANALITNITGETDAALYPNVSYTSLNNANTSKVGRSGDGSPVFTNLH